MEAFRAAVQKNPESPMVQELERVYQSQEPEKIKQKEEEQFTLLKEQFKETGLLWFGTRIDQSVGRSRGYDRIPIDQKKKQWTLVLATLKDKSFEERIHLLEALASGMHLIEDIAPADNSRYGRRFLPHVLYERSKLSGINFTRPSTFFMEAFSDISDHSEDQKQQFKDFIVDKSGLKGTIGLFQLLPAINRWIDHDPSPTSNT